MLAAKIVSNPSMAWDINWTFKENTMTKRLFTIYNRYNLWMSLIVLLIGGISYTLIIRWILVRQLNLELHQEKDEITAYVSANQALLPPMSFKGQIVKYDTANKPFKEEIKNEYKFVQVKPKHRKKFKIYRSITFPLTVKGKIYRCTVLRSQAETEDLIQILLLCTFSLAILLWLLIFMGNRLLFRKLWNPFKKTLLLLQNFKLSNNTDFESTPTNITEFEELNVVAQKMTNQVKREYNALKSFTENASHEIQTPLAIIKTKLELLMQSEHIKQSDIENIEESYEASIRLSRLNKALILLTKIENNQYHQTEKVEISHITKSLINQYQELISSSHITLTTDFQTEIHVNMDLSLVEIMIGNLIRNAIRHNLAEDGFISITTTKNQFQISNSGATTETNTQRLFERFQKSDDASNSLGLGLAIVLKIIEQYHFTIHYDIHEETHILTVRFDKA